MIFKIKINKLFSHSAIKIGSKKALQKIDAPRSLSVD